MPKVLKIDLKFSKCITPKLFKTKSLNYFFFSAERRNRRTKIYTSILSKKFVLKNVTLCSGILKKNYQRVLSPDIIYFKNKYFLFYEFKKNNRTGIAMAVSINLIKWKFIKELFFERKSNISYGSPKCIINKKNNSIFLYYYKSGKNFKRIYYSKLDLNFNIIKNYNLPIVDNYSDLEHYSVYAPEIIYEKNKYKMFYSGWGGKLIKGRIFSMTSNNGIKWINKKIIHQGKKNNDTYKHYSEPSFGYINKKKYLFFEACDLNNNWKILYKKI